MKRIKLSAATVLLIATTNVMAAGPTATLQVKGTITPAACTPTLSNGGIVDFGTTSSAEITDSKLELQPKNVQLQISCTAPTKLEFNIIDNRADSATSDVHSKWSGAATVSNMGLGKTSDGKKIGTYVIATDEAKTQIDDSQGDLVWHYTSSSIWDVWGDASINVSSTTISVAHPGESKPAAFTDATIDLNVYPILSNEMKDITEIQNLDGNATLNFNYF